MEKFKYLTLTVLSLLLFISCGKNIPEVRFEVDAAGVADGEKVFITGNNEKLGMWSPGKIELEKENDSLWVLEEEFEPGTILEFKFTKGRWTTEGVHDNGDLMMNYTFRVDNDTTFRVSINKWKNEFEYEEFEGGVTGKLEYMRSVKPEGLKQRDVSIWLPPGYENNTTERYPVIYMLDGQNLFDPSTSSFGVDWQLDEAADSLVRQNEITPVIIVGINNTADRSQEYTYSDTGKIFREFLVNDLKSRIDSLYRTNPGREYTAIGGSSLGGLAAFIFGWEYPGTFSKVIAFSPAVKIRTIDYLSVAEKDKNKKNLRIYIYNGGEGLEAELRPGVDETITFLASRGYIKGENLFIAFTDSAGHSESAWAEQVPDMLKTLFGK